MNNLEISNICEVLLKLGLTSKDKLQMIYPEIYKKESPTKGYRKITMFDSIIHIYETNKNEFLDVTLGIEGKLEKLSKIDDVNVEESCKINCGYFNFDGSKEHLGLFLRDGKIYNSYDNTYINFVYYKNGKTDIRYVDNYEWINYWRSSAHWVIGCGYSLVKDGEVNLTNAEVFSHSKSDNPRTMIGQLVDQTFILAVAEGRSIFSQGLTATEQAEVMKTLGCVNAVNLDGGGSSQMIVEDKIVNTLSDGFERSIGSSMFVRKL